MPDVYRTMLAKDAIAAKLAYCVLNNLNGERILLMQAKNLEAKFDKNKVEVPILGRTSVGHRATNWNGTGSMTIYSNTSRFTELMRQYQETGQDFYFDIIIRNYDPTSAAGGQTIILKDCNLYKKSPTLIACPTCGRTQIDLIPIAKQVEEFLQNIESDITVAVMGCAVNGPGEAREADIGIAGGIKEGLLFKKGKIIKKVKQDEIVNCLKDEIIKMVNNKV